jgi:hypothetical protein
MVADSTNKQTNERTNEMTTTATNYWTATANAAAATAALPVKQQHVPGFKLTLEQRDIKSDEHKYGLCCSCDAGLDDRADFVCFSKKDGELTLRCNACDEYYTQGPSYAH